MKIEFLQKRTLGSLRCSFRVFLKQCSPFSSLSVGLCELETPGAVSGSSSTVHILKVFCLETDQKNSSQIIPVTMTLHVIPVYKLVYEKKSLLILGIIHPKI